MATAQSIARPYRTSVVAPADPRRETLGVGVLLAALVAACIARILLVGDHAGSRPLAPYQRADSTLTGIERTLYRNLSASVADILYLRDREGFWPEAELLAAENVPPFAKLLLPPKLRGYVWTGHDGGSWIDYLGTDPRGEIETSFVLRLIDLHAGYHPNPHPGIDYDPELSIATQIWMLPEPVEGYPGERLVEAGWLWLLPDSERAALTGSDDHDSAAPAATDEAFDGRAAE